MRRAWLCLALFGGLLAACAPFIAADSAPQSHEEAVIVAPRSEWRAVYALGVAEQGDAPALIVGAESIIAVWVSADERDTYHTLRRINTADGAPGAVNRLPIVTAFPRHYQAARAAQGFHHLLWLDADPQEPLAGMRLWALLIDNTPDATRGAFIANDHTIYHHALLPGDDGTLWVFYSAAPISEPTIYAQFFDSVNRPRSPVALVSAGERPAAVRFADGTPRLFWQSVTDGTLRSAAFDGDSRPSAERGEVALHVTAPALSAGDFLEHLHVAVDATHVYAFWNISHHRGAFAATWYATAPQSALDDWTTPRRLTLDSVADVSPDVVLSWASPAGGVPSADGLPVAVAAGDELGVVTLRGGAVVSYEAVAPLDAPGLIGTPTLHADSAGRLTLAWAQPAPDGAHLYIAQQ